MGDPDVTACIPAYRSGAFIGATLETLRAQSYGNFRALISIDGPDRACETVCRDLARADPRFEVVVQPQRLGWLGNINALFDRVATPFYFLLPHDDRLEPTYIEVLRAEAMAYPEAVNVYCDMHRSGGRREDFPTVSGLDGPIVSRLTAMLASPVAGVAWRGLIRRSLDGGLRQRPNAFDGYNAHVLWLLELLCLGPFRRVPLVLYRQWERTDPDSVTTSWRSWSRERRYAATAEHTLQCIERLSLAGGLAPDDRQALVLMLLLRLLGHPGADAPFTASPTAGVDGRLIRVAELLARAHGAPYLDGEEACRLQHESVLAPLMAKLRVRDAVYALGHERLAAAEAAIESALALDPANEEAHWRKALLLRRRGRIEEALAEIQQARQGLPKNPKVRLELGVILALAGDLDGAVAAVRSAIELQPGLARAHHELSLLLDRCGQIPDALAEAERAVQADPERLRYRENHQRLLLRTKAAG